MGHNVILERLRADDIVLRPPLHARFYQVAVVWRGERTTALAYHHVLDAFSVDVVALSVRSTTASEIVRSEYGLADSGPVPTIRRPKLSQPHHGQLRIVSRSA